MGKMWDLEEEVRQTIRDRAEEIVTANYPNDLLTEIADSAVPIYNSDRVECLLDDLSLSEPDDAGLVEGVTDIFAILAVSIYEKLYSFASEEYDTLVEESARECPECYGDHTIYDSDWDEAAGMCDKCVEEKENHRVCSVCKDTFDKNDVDWNEGEGMCDDCVEERDQRQCHVCHGEFSKEDLDWNETRGMCEECIDEELEKLEEE